MKLGINGVVVQGVSDGLPAAEGGIVKGDIIVTANGKNITNQTDLAAVVAEAGEDEFEIELLHEGEKKTVSLKPKMTKPDDIPWIGFGKDPDQMNRYFYRRVGPGVQLRGHEDMDKQISELMQKARKAAQEARSLHAGGAGIMQELTKLRKRVAELEKRLADDKTQDETAE